MNSKCLGIYVINAVTYAKFFCLGGFGWDCARAHVFVGFFFSLLNSLIS